MKKLENKPEEIKNLSVPVADKESSKEKPGKEEAPQILKQLLRKMDNHEEIIEIKSITSRSVRFGVIVMLAVFLFFGVWGGFAPLESAAVATGSVVLDSSRKTIQHLEGGIIIEMLVKDGDEVFAGQPLLKLNSTTASARQDLLMGQWHYALATEARLAAERDEQPEIEFGEILLAEKDNPEVIKTIDTQKRLFDTRKKSLSGQVEILEQRVAQLNNQIDGLEAQKKATITQQELIAEEVETVEKLVAKGQGLKPRLLELKRRQAELQGKEGEYIAEIAKVREAIGENKLQSLNIKNEALKNTVDELKETQQKVADLSEQMNASVDVLSRTIITAPQSGIVTGMKYHTVGGVITPGAAIMDIVPEDDDLVVEAQVSPSDIDVVREGMTAKVMLSAYRSRFVPRLNGEVIRISADKFTDENSGASYYIARIRIDEKEIEELGENVELYPGMPAEVFIVTGSSTLLDYLISPITDSFRRAFREQ